MGGRIKMIKDIVDDKISEKEIENLKKYYPWLKPNIELEKKVRIEKLKKNKSKKKIRKDIEII